MLTLHSLIVLHFASQSISNKDRNSRVMFYCDLKGALKWEAQMWTAFSSVWEGGTLKIFLFILPTTWESNAAILSSVFNNSRKVQSYVSALHLLKAPLSVVDVFGVFFFMYTNTTAHDGIQIYKFHHHHHYKQYLQLAATRQHDTADGKRL